MGAVQRNIPIPVIVKLQSVSLTVDDDWRLFESFSCSFMNYLAAVGVVVFGVLLCHNDVYFRYPNIFVAV